MVQKTSKILIGLQYRSRSRYHLLKKNMRLQIYFLEKKDYTKNPNEM